MRNNKINKLYPQESLKPKVLNYESKQLEIGGGG